MFDLNIIVWSILSGVLAAFIIFFFLTWKINPEKTKKKHAPLLALAVILVFCFGIGLYVLSLPQFNRNGVKFPETGLNPTSQVSAVSVESLYGTPINMLITLSLLVAIFFLAIGAFRNIKRGKEIDRVKTELVFLASHQLRTPLTTVKWYIEMILNGDAGPVIPKQKKYLEEIYKGNQQMVEIVNTLLDVSRIELGTFKVEPKPTDIIALAQSALDEQKSNIEKKRLRITESFSKEIPFFSTDPKLLRMVFQNLLTNAVKYTPENGKIEFAISFDKMKTLCIKVSDTGYGIPKNQQSKIFTKLFRADNVRNKDTEGTGLGLYIVKSIVLRLEGRVWFESEENKGATFYVALPINNKT